MMKTPIYIATLLLALFILASSCKDDAPRSEYYFGTERYDSAALHIALMPNRDCLPVYYAKRTGLFDSLGVRVQIASYKSQMDCDKMLFGKKTDGGWADLKREVAARHIGSDYRCIIPCSQPWQLYVCGTLRVKDVKALKGRTVGIARRSAESEWLDLLLSAHKISADEIYRPQINDLLVRARMLTGNQIDAALLAWPYTSLAKASGHRLLATQPKAEGNGCFVMKPVGKLNAEQQKQYVLFLKGCNMAVDSIRLKGPQGYSVILQKDYGLPKEIADTVKVGKFGYWPVK